MQRVHVDDIYCDVDCNYMFNGAPFTGILFDTRPDGSIWSEFQVIEGHQEGIGREWYESGQLKLEGSYLGDGLHGISREWHPNGQLNVEKVCEYGICLQSKEWDETGRLIQECHLEPSDWRYDLLLKKRSIWRRGERDSNE